MLQNYSADSLHGDLSQAQRDTVMKKFRVKNIQILVATDVAARGLDVNSLTHVIHFSLPDDPEIFVHRSGRTGRAGKFGQSICLIKPDESRKLKRIENECSIKIIPFNIPTNEVILTAQIDGIIEKISSEEVMNSQFKLPTIPDLSEITKEELFEKFVFLYLKDTIEYYEKHPSIEYSPSSRDFNSDRGSDRDRGRGERRERFERSDDRRERSDDRRGSRDREERSPRGEKRRDGRPSNANYTRFFINLGKKDSLSKIDLLGLINRNTPGSRVDIGDIDIRDKFSFFEVDSNFKNQLLENFNQNSYNGKNMSLEVAN